LLVMIPSEERDMEMRNDLSSTDHTAVHFTPAAAVQCRDPFPSAPRRA
jgi:hypothetical protein